MAKIKGKQINQLVGQAHWNTSGVSIPAGSSTTITTLFTGKVSGGSNTVEGVYTTPPHNKIFLRRASTGKPLTDLTNEVSIFARLTESSGSWVLTFYSLVNGTETVYNFNGTTDVGAVIDFRWCESVQLSSSLPTAIVYAGEGIDEFDASSPNSHQHIVEEILITTNNQSAFSISNQPKDPTDLVLKVNGVTYIRNVDYTVSGTNLVWLNTDFTLQTTDALTVEYAY